MADIFEEVEEGLRQDRMTVLWKQYGVFAYLAGALVIGGVAFFESRQHVSAQNIETHATSLESGLAALADQEYESAATQLSALIDENVAVSPVAAHFLADVRLDGNGDAVAASDVLLATTGDVVNDPTAALALLKAAYLQADTASLAELESLLAPLLGTGTGFAALAQELIAAKMLESGDLVGARRAFTNLRLSDNVPPGVITRANQALSTLPVIVEETAEAAPSEALEGETATTPDAVTDENKTAPTEPETEE